jgi:hypothetical protein
MRKAMVIAGLVGCVCALTPLPASALTDWDPDDVAGPFDLRRVEAEFDSPMALTIVVSFHDGFRTGALHRTPFVPFEGVQVELQSFEGSPVSTGFFLRRAGGKVVFIWGDYGSTCGGVDYPHYCNRGLVRRLSRNVLSVTIDPRRTDALEFTVYAETTWTTADDVTVTDRTDELALGFPPA